MKLYIKYIVFSLTSLAMHHVIMAEVGLKDSYILKDTGIWSSDTTTVSYVKYNFLPDGTGEDIRVCLNKRNDSIAYTIERYPLSWELDPSLRLTVQTAVSQNFVTYRQFDLDYGGSRLVFVDALNSVLFPVKFDCAQCPTDFADPRFFRNQQDIYGLFDTLLEPRKYEDNSLNQWIWPYKAKKEPYWDSGTFRIERIISVDGIQRIIVSKNGIEYTIIAPPDNPHSRMSKLYQSWNALKKMQIGKEVNLFLEMYSPVMDKFDGTAPPCYRPSAYSLSPLDGGVDDTIYIYGKHAAGSYYGYIKQQSE